MLTREELHAWVDLIPVTELLTLRYSGYRWADQMRAGLHQLVDQTAPAPDPVDPDQTRLGVEPPGGVY